MISVGNNKAIIYKGDFHPAQLYKGDKKIAGYNVEEFEGENGVTLENCYNDKLHNAQIIGNTVQDGTPTPETPVEVQSVGELVTEGEYAGKYKIPVTARGKNLFKYISPAIANGTVIESLPTGVIVEGKVTENTNIYGYDKGWFRSGNTASTAVCPILHTGDIVTVSVDITLLELRAYDYYTPRINFYSREANTGYLSVANVPVKVGETKRFSSTFTIAEKYDGHTFFPIITLNSNLVKIENIQIEYGNEATPFEPYIEPQTFNIYLDEPLRKVGDYADYVDFKKMVVVNRVGITKIKDLSWNKMSDSTTSDGTVLQRHECKVVQKRNFVDRENTIGNIFCNGLINVAYVSYAMRDKSISERVDAGNNGTGRRIRILTSEYSTVSAMVSAFGEFDIYYILDEPYITEEPIELPELPTYKGTTIYEIDTEIPATISGKYKKVEVAV